MMDQKILATQAECAPDALICLSPYMEDTPTCLWTIDCTSSDLTKRGIIETGCGNKTHVTKKREGTVCEFCSAGRKGLVKIEGGEMVSLDRYLEILKDEERNELQNNQ